jgi:acyl-CoA thioesterase-2
MPVADLVEALQLEETGPNTFRAQNYELGERGVVFGGQLIAQLIAAGATVDPTKLVKSATALFARPVMVEDDVELRVDVLQSGRTFASATASLWQGPKERARAIVLLTAEEPDLIRHSSPMPDVPTADEIEGGAFGNENARIVGDIDIGDADAVHEPELQVWTRWPNATDEQAVSQGLLAQSSCSFLIATAMFPHAGVGQSAAHAAFSTGIIGHTISFHEPFDAREWMLLSQQSTYSGRGRAYGSGEVFSDDGRLIASYSQESMIRHFPEGISPEGQESTIL